MKLLHFIIVVFLVAAIKEISGGNAITKTIVRTDIKGRLLTPEEGCGYSKVANTRIVGGAPAKVGAWPWLALVGRESFFGFEFECGGTLITSEHVLTAAHCNTPKINIVRLGEHELGTTKDGIHQDIPVVRVKQHKSFNSYLMTDDIAIVYLERDVEFTGWGAIKNNGPLAKLLQQAQLPVIENSQCKEDYQKIGEFSKNIQFSDRVLCAGFREGGKDSCDGDSGGPLMLPIQENGRFPFYQIGIISWGEGCGRPNVPGIYTNVQYYSDWIIKSIGL